MYSSKNKSKILQREKGITLIALVVTIVVLLILAGVSISMLSGDDGIIINAEKAKEETDSKGVQEQVELMTSEYIMQKNTGGEESIKKYYQTQASKGEISSIKDNGDNTYTISKDGYEVKIDENGKTIEVNEKEKVPVTDIWYKIEGTTLHFSSSDLGGYTKHDYNLIPEWKGSDTNPSPITKVIVENVIAPAKTSSWFYAFENLTEIENIENLNTSNVTSMSYMFYRCSSLTEIDISGFDTSNVTSAFGMFCLCSNLEKIDLSNFDTSKLTSMNQMFQSCRNLKEINLTSFNTSNVTSMIGMFVHCSNLTNLDLSGFDTRKVKSSIQMLDGVVGQVYIGNDFTLTPEQTSYNGTFQTK